MNTLPEVTVNIRVGESYTRCNNCMSHYLKATPAGLVCAHCGKLYTESEFISLMKDAYKRHLKQEELPK